ncbi:MAG: hypothetical protein GF334_11530 [Candidatus Altiarchaeales archaeon]|nr:hypothetical protein [Candidatus Altiarchaeales archaeon]
MERVKSGIEGFDNLLGGGFLNHSVNLLSGCSGSGKTIFAVYYIYNGAKKFGEKGLYITLEEMTEHIVRDVGEIGLNLEDVDDELFHMYDLSALRANVLSTKDELSSPESPMRLDNLLEFIELNFQDAKRIAIDSLVPLNMVYEDMKTLRGELFRFTIGLKRLGITTVLTTEIPYSSHDLSRFGMEDFLSDSVTVFRMREEWGRQVKVHKMRGSNHFKDYVDYTISNQGLQVMYK